MKTFVFFVIFIFMFSMPQIFSKNFNGSKKLDKKESISLVTYYPAPFGDYENISTNSIENYVVISNPKLGQSFHDSLNDFNPVCFNKSIKILGRVCGPYTNKNPSLSDKFIKIEGNGNVTGTLRMENGYVLGYNHPKRKIVSKIIDVGTVAENTLAKVKIPCGLKKIDNIVVSLHNVKGFIRGQETFSSVAIFLATTVINDEWYCIVENRSSGKREISISFIAAGI